MKKVLDKFPKNAIGELPRALFEGRVEVVCDESEATRAVDFLLTQPVLGFDTETRPAFKKGHVNQVSLLQVSTENICFLFRLNKMGIPACVVKLLEDCRILKVGLSWHDDIAGLQRRERFNTGTFVELQSLVKEFGIKDQSLQKLFAGLMGRKISKSQRLSNWDADALSEAQKRYAATDAWACIVLYKELMKMKEEGCEVVFTPEPETQIKTESQVIPEKKNKRKITKKRFSKEK